MIVDVKFTTKQIWHGKQITEELAKELQNEFYNSAGRIMQAAKSNIHSVSGRLARSIRRTRPRDRSKPEAYVIAGDRRNDVYWHGFVEYGTAKMAAHPFMRPAADGARYDVISGAQKAGRRVINKPKKGVV